MLRTDEMSDFHLNKDYFGKLRVFEGVKKRKGKIFREVVSPDLNIHYWILNKFVFVETFLNLA